MQKKETENMPPVKRENWNVRDLSEQGVNQSDEDILRQTLRGDEQKGNPDDRDVTGRAPTNETPQGREENKHKAKRERN